MCRIRVMHHHTEYHTAHTRVLDEIHALTPAQVRALSAQVSEPLRTEQFEATMLTTELEDVLLDGPERRIVTAHIADREELRDAAGHAPHRINVLDLDAIDDDTFDEILGEVDRFTHVIDCLAFALTEYARHGMHGRSVRYQLLIQPWAAMMGDPLDRAGLTTL